MIRKQLDSLSLNVIAMICAGLLSGSIARADRQTSKALQIVTTTADLAAVAKALVPDATIQSLSVGSEDPHDIEAKPSFVGLLRNSDLVIVNGAGLEDGWLPGILVAGKRDRADLDVVSAADFVHLKAAKAKSEHSKGNPHFMLDPENVVLVAEGLAKRLSAKIPQEKNAIENRLKSFKSDMQTAEVGWKKSMAESPYRSAVTYHAGLDYFLDRFGIEAAGTLEPEPGMQPTASHLLALEKNMKTKKTRLILVEHYEDDSQAKRLRGDIAGSVTERAFVSVGARSDLVRNQDVINAMVLLFRAQAL